MSRNVIFCSFSEVTTLERRQHVPLDQKNATYLQFSAQKVTKILCYGVACLDFPPWPSILYVIIILLGVLFKMLPGIL